MSKADLTELMRKKAELEEQIQQAIEETALAIGKEAQRLRGKDVSPETVITGLYLVELAKGEAPALLEKATAQAQKFLPKRRGRKSAKDSS